MSRKIAEISTKGIMGICVLAVAEYDHNKILEITEIIVMKQSLFFMVLVSKSMMICGNLRFIGQDVGGQQFQPMDNIDLDIQFQDIHRLGIVASIVDEIDLPSEICDPIGIYLHQVRYRSGRSAMCEFPSTMCEFLRGKYKKE